MVYTDASNAGLGCVLMQNEKVVVYASCQLKSYDLKLKTLAFSLKI